MDASEEWLVAWLEKPSAKDMICEGDFDPWDLFPAIYGSYSAEFDHAMIDILEQWTDFGYVRKANFGQEILLEMLCVNGLADYGTSPRTAFPEQWLKPYLPHILVRWQAYAERKWGNEK